MHSWLISRTAWHFSKPYSRQPWMFRKHCVPSKLKRCKVISRRRQTGACSAKLPRRMQIHFWRRAFGMQQSLGVAVIGMKEQRWREMPSLTRGLEDLTGDYKQSKMTRPLMCIFFQDKISPYRHTTTGIVHSGTKLPTFTQNSHLFPRPASHVHASTISNFAVNPGPAYCVTLMLWPPPLFQRISVA